MLKNYHELAAARESQGIPPLPLNEQQTHELTLLLEKPPEESNRNFLLDLLKNRIPP